MKVFVIILLLIWKSNIVFSQGLFLVLHPVVGDTIDKKEKKDYLLFPEVKDSVFKSCVIKEINGKFYVITDYIGDSVSKTEIESSVLKRYHVNIEKLHSYYKERAKGVSSGTSFEGGPRSDPSSGPKLNKNLVAPPLTEEMKNEVIRDDRLKDDAERMKYTRQGGDLIPGQIHIYDPGKGSKKKK